jgi:hypothetical protein
LECLLFLKQVKNVLFQISQSLDFTGHVVADTFTSQESIIG